MNRWHAFTQLVLARLREFFREPEAVFWVYGFPLILALGLGLAFSGGTPEPPTVDVQEEPSPERARELSETLVAAKVQAHVFSQDECQARLRKGRTSLIIVDGKEGLSYVFDPTRAESLHARHWVDAILTRAAAGERAPKTRDVVVNEPGSRYIDFLLPGLVGINLMGGGLFGIGFVLVDMRVRKLFKRLMATPIHRGDFLLSMLVSRMVFLLPEMFSLLVVARWLFGVPVVGSWLTLALVVLMGAVAFAGIGLLLGCRTEKTETISGLINLVMLPMYLLSGVFFSARRFPDFMQPVIQLLPLTQLNDALREVMLEGAGLVDISGRLLILSSWAGICFLLALRWFKWT